MKKVLGTVVSLLLSTVVQSAGAPRTQVLLIGTYHFSNPNQDLNNVKAVDVMTEPRQREIAAVVTSLARFNPTRVAVEWPDALVNERYPKFVAGKLEDSRNEVIQLGFKLARERNLPEVLGLDVKGDFPFGEVAEWAEKNGRKQEIEALMAFGARETEYISQLQNKTTIGGVLRDMNSAESIDRAHSFYPVLLDMGKGDDQPGVNLLSAWYTRNIAICARLLEAVKPGDRVVVFYGQGHIYLLRQCLREQPSVQLVDPLAYLP